MSTFVITLPKSLDFETALEFCSTLEPFTGNETLVLDFKHVRDVNPFGMLVVAAKIREVHSRFKSNGNTLTCRSFRGNDYAAHMGFYRSFKLPHGKRPGEASGSERYLPITLLKATDLEADRQDMFEHFGYALERRADRLATILAQGKNALSDSLSYSIREIMRNVFEHSSSDSLWFAAQAWPTHQLVEISILDEGVGVRTSLANNLCYNAKCDESALLLALEPGISGNAAAGKGDDPWNNTGYGLYMTSQLCKRGGNFAICSGERAIFLNADGLTLHPTAFRGTAIRMRLYLPELTTLAGMLEELHEEGGRRAEANSNHLVLSASKLLRVQ